MKTINFYKLTGAGNDFILFDRKENPGLDITPDFAAKVCSRRFGIGADGIIVIDDSDTYDFNMSFFNADGSTGVLCGNGARCAIKYGKFSGRLKESGAKFTLNGILYSGEIISESIIKFNLNEPKDFKREMTVYAAEHLIKGSFINTGSPHFIINIEDVFSSINDKKSFYTDFNDFPAKEIGKEIRYSKAFAPEGVNVNFILIDKDVVKIRTYERGVEDETLACGTGSTATAIVAVMNYHVKQPVKLLTRGGEILTVDFSLEGSKISNLSLSGPAKIVFKGEITI